MDYIISTNLQICNVGNTPTFTNAVRGEVIDLSLATTNTIDKIKDWKVETQNTLSDHNKITFTYTTELIHPQNTFRNVKKTDWIIYKTLLYENLENMRVNFDETDLNTKAKLLETAIKNAFENSCPLRKRKNSTKPIWWNTELSDLKKETLRRKNQYKRESTELRKQNWKEAASEYRRACRKAKSENWTAFCSEQKDNSAIAKLQKLMKNDKRVELGTIKKTDGNYTETPEDTLTELLKQLYPDDTSEGQHIDTPAWQNFRAVDVDKMINRESVTEAIKSFKP